MILFHPTNITVYLLQYEDGRTKVNMTAESIMLKNSDNISDSRNFSVHTTGLLVSSNLHSFIQDLGKSERENLRTGTVDGVTSWDLREILQPVKASNVVSVQQGLALTNSDRTNSEAGKVNRAGRSSDEKFQKRNDQAVDGKIQQSPLDGPVPKQASPLSSAAVEQCSPSTSAGVAGDRVHQGKAGPSRQPGSCVSDTPAEIGCHCLARTGSSVGAQLQDEASRHGKTNTETSVLSMGYEAETTRHTPVLSARFSVPNKRDQAESLSLGTARGSAQSQRLSLQAEASLQGKKQADSSV